MSKTRTLLFRIALSAAFGVLMFWSDIIMDALPNVHLLAMFIVTFTVVYRVWALLPIYVYVFLNGLFYGFTPTWIPNLYIWTVLWAVVMILPKNMPQKIQGIVYMIVCSLHGFLFGILYAPAQALIFGLSFKGMIAWIVAGFPFDLIHGISNLVCGILIMPVVKLLKKITK